MVKRIVLGNTKIVPLNKLKQAWDLRCIRDGVDLDSQDTLHAYWKYCSELRSKGYILLSKYEAISFKLLGIYNQ